MIIVVLKDFGNSQRFIENKEKNKSKKDKQHAVLILLFLIVLEIVLNYSLINS